MRYNFECVFPRVIDRVNLYIQAWRKKPKPKPIRFQKTVVPTLALNNIPLNYWDTIINYVNQFIMKDISYGISYYQVSVPLFCQPNNKKICLLSLGHKKLKVTLNCIVHLNEKKHVNVKNKEISSNDIIVVKNLPNRYRWKKRVPKMT